GADHMHQPLASRSAAGARYSAGTVRSPKRWSGHCDGHAPAGADRALEADLRQWLGDHAKSSTRSIACAWPARSRCRPPAGWATGSARGGEHLGALQVADFNRQPLDAARDHRQRREIHRVARPCCPGGSSSP
ncbi:hypothetical protein I5L01_15570, partial [Erythrobacter sp. YJ-T3-07]|nr:hypothetical protein [Erythrobacter sp. YJ-T3-07]